MAQNAESERTGTKPMVPVAAVQIIHSCAIG